MLGYELLDNFLKDSQEHYAKNTIRQYKRDIIFFLDHHCHDIPNVKCKDIKKHLQMIDQSGKSASTIHGHANSLKTFFQYCIEENQLKVNPCIGLSLPKLPEPVPRYLDDLTVFKIREAAKTNIRDIAILETLYYTGVRVSELINIKIEDVDFKNLEIWISESKNGYSRMVPMSQICAVRISNYLNRRSDNNPYLFISIRKEHFSRQGIVDIVKKYSEIAGFDPSNISPHCYRHTFATKLASKKIPFAVIAKLLGHKGFRNVKVYAKIMTEIRSLIYNEYH